MPTIKQAYILCDIFRTFSLHFTANVIYLQQMLKIYHIMNKKETLSITQKYTIQYVINGCLWLLYSISNLISLKPVKIIGAVILFISAFCSFYTLLAKQESDDEMSIQHILSAKSMSLEILLCSMMIVGILSVFISFPFFKAYGFFVSASQILPGLLFLKFEKEGY